MACLYLLWLGPVEEHWETFGIHTCGQLPYFDYPQYSFTGLYSTTASKPSAIALSDRIFVAYNSSWRWGGLEPNGSSSLSSFAMQSWPNYIGIIGVPGTASSFSPALAPWGPGAIMVWPGLGNDTRIWWAQYYTAQNTWSVQQLTQVNNGGPIQSGSTPAIINWNGRLFMVWRGEGDNDNLYYATSTDGHHWTGNEGIPGAASTIQPAVLIFNGNIIVAFKGGKNDTGIYTTTYHANTNSWAPVVSCGQFGTSHGPCLALYQGQIFMAWKGIPGDTNLYWAVSTNNLDPHAWSGQSVINGVGSDVGPIAVVY